MSMLSDGVTLLLGAAAAFSSVTLLVMLATAHVLERRSLYRGLRTVRTIELSPNQLDKRELANPFRQRVLMPSFGKLARLGRRLTPVGVVERLDEELGWAGHPWGLSAEIILVLKGLLPGVGILGGIVVTQLAGLSGVHTLIAVAAAGFIGYYLPEWVVRSKASKRQTAIQKALPDSLDLLSITVEAGLGFDAALSKVAKEVSGPFGQELHRVIHGIQIGEERIEALRGLAARNNVQELESFVLAMIQADLLGISVSTVLEVQAREMRLKRRQRAEEKAQKLPVKILFPLIFFMFPALLVAVIGPGALQVMDTILQQ